MSELASGHTVRDIIIDDEYSTIDSSATVLEAAELMQEMGIPDLVVLDVDEQIVIGVISDFNIINDIVAAARNPRKVSIKEATSPIEPVTLDTRAPWIAAHLIGDRLTTHSRWPALRQMMKLPG